MIRHLITNFKSTKIYSYHQLPSNPISHQIHTNLMFSSSKPNQQNQESKSTLDTTSGKYKFGLTLTAIGLFAGVLGYYVFGNESCEVQKKVEQRWEKISIGGSWQMIDTQGKLLSSQSLKGNYYIIYFGFTKCPDICPATLTSLMNIKKFVETDPEGKDIPLKIVFVSVDPQRDSPQQLKKYLSLFGPDIIGLTGIDSNDTRLKDCMKKFKIYANKVSTQSSYSIDHTTMMYLMDKNNNLLDLINPSLPEKESSKHLIKKIASKEKKG